MTRRARYDAVADWYPSWVGDGGGLIAELSAIFFHRHWLVQLAARPVVLRRGWWTSTAHNPDGVRIRVGSSHRTLSTYLNALIDAGFSLELAVEPPAPVPTFLLLRCRRDYQSWSV
jgi:hypothetical protein